MEESHDTEEELPPKKFLLPAKSSKTILLEKELKSGKGEALQKKDENREYKELLLKQKGDQADIYYYLHKKLDDNFDLISELERQIISEQTDRERKKQDYIKQIEEKRSTLEKNTAFFQEKIDKLRDSLHTLKETEEKKGALESRVEELEIGLEQEQKQHKVEMDRLDRIKIQGKQRLKRAQASKIRETEEQLEKTIKQELKMKTKQIRYTNDQMHSALRQKSEASERLVTEHSKLTAAGKRLKGQLEVHTSMVQELQSKNSMFEQILEDLNKRLQALAREQMEKKKEEDEMASSESRQSSSMMAFRGPNQRRSVSPIIREGSHESDSGESEEAKQQQQPPTKLGWDIEGWERHIKSLERSFQKVKKDLERADKRRNDLALTCTKLTHGQDDLVKFLYDTVTWLQDEVYHPESDSWPSEVRWAADEDGVTRIPLYKLPPGERRQAFGTILRQLHQHQIMKYDQTHSTMSGVSFPPIMTDPRASPISSFNPRRSTASNSLAPSEDYASLSSIESKETLQTEIYSINGTQKQAFTAEVACQTPWVPTENIFSSARSRFGLKTSSSVKISHHKVDVPPMSDDTATVQTGISELSFGTQASTLVGMSPRKQRGKGRMVSTQSFGGGSVSGSQSSFISKKYRPKPPGKGGNISQWPT